MIVEFALLHAQPGKAPELREAFQTARPVIAQAPGYLGSLFHQGIEEPHSFILRIEWVSLEAHLRFRETALLGQWRGHFFHLLEAPPKVTHYETFAGP